MSSPLIYRLPINTSVTYSSVPPSTFYPSFIYLPWRRKWQPTPVLLPGKSHGRRSLISYSPWGHEESATTERLHFYFSLYLSTHLAIICYQFISIDLSIYLLFIYPSIHQACIYHLSFCHLSLHLSYYLSVHLSSIYSSAICLATFLSTTCSSIYLSIYMPIYSPMNQSSYLSFIYPPIYLLGFPGVSVVQNLVANAGDTEDTSSIPGSGRCPGGRHGNPLQHPCLENPTDRAAWQAAVPGATEMPATAEAPEQAPSVCDLFVICEPSIHPSIHPSKHHSTTSQRLGIHLTCLPT